MMNGGKNIPDIKKRSMNYYTYQNKNVTCEKCKWQGKGSETQIGEIFESLFEIDCPKCNHTIDHVYYPTEAEVLEYGTESEKNEIWERQKRIEEFEKQKLKHPEQLPDIETPENLTFIITASQDGEQIEISCNNKTVWSESRWYEYYERYIEIGEILQQKYSNRLIDFIPENDNVYLYGDRYVAISIVEQFRKSLIQQQKHKVIPFANEGIIDPPKVKNAVYNRIDFELPEHIWLKIESAFAECWNERIGIGGDVYENQIENYINQKLKEGNTIFDTEKTRQIVKIIYDYIEMSGGFLDD